ncbi:DUF6504 family protein [Streptacidiphilus sp. EB129]|jgi:hypothetical protein|uniref:DUF6504 family protein n=1 Tax=Streptacidiphilus sp. EB129 TaxID=3156262 RepID=UPI003512E1C8
MAEVIAMRSDLIEVRGDPGQPTHFLWRDRVYAVREVLGRSNGAGHEVWRVQASPGRCFDAGVYDLSFDRAAGRWTLTSTTD